jgi:hypothetical protein
VNKITIIVAAIAVLSGCFSQISKIITPRDGHVDLSGSDSVGVAIIRGSTWDIGVAYIDCWIRHPANAKRLTIQAGITDIFAMCSSGVADEVVKNAAFHFEALAGHEYVISQRTCEDCIRLRDVTADEVVAESPHNPLGIVVDLSTGDNTATIEGFTYGNDQGCWLTDGYVDLLIVDAGTVAVDSTCALLSLNPLRVPFRAPRVSSSFDFKAETGHSYQVSAIGGLGDEKCVKLSDITSESIVIACEPYEKSK